MEQRSRYHGHLLVILAAIIWSFTSPGLKVLLDGGAHPLALAFWRDAIIAVACVGGLLLIRPKLLRVSRGELAKLGLTGAISIGIYHALWVWSIALNGAAVAVVMIYLFPTFVSIGAWMLWREPLRWPHILALVLSLVGCGLLVRVYDPSVLRVSWVGILVGLLTALTHTIYVLFSQRSVQQRSPWTSLTYTMLFGSLTLLVLLLAVAGWTALQGNPEPLEVFEVGAAYGQNWIAWVVLAILALGPTLGGYGIFTAALRQIPGRIASLIVVIEAPISSMLAVWLVGETLEELQIVGIGLILIAIVLPTFLQRMLVRSAVADGVVG